MVQAPAAPRNRIVSLVFLLLCAAAGAAAAVVGITDNLHGILLLYLAATAFCLAVVHPWRASTQFKRFATVALVGLPTTVILHNVFDAAAFWARGVIGLHAVLDAIAVVAFFAAVLLCPAALLVGGAGWLVMALREWRRPA